MPQATLLEKWTLVHCWVTLPPTLPLGRSVQQPEHASCAWLNPCRDVTSQKLQVLCVQVMEHPAGIGYEWRDCRVQPLLVVSRVMIMERGQLLGFLFPLLVLLLLLLVLVAAKVSRVLRHALECRMLPQRFESP